jgi:hypothetical protein
MAERFATEPSQVQFVVADSAPAVLMIFVGVVRTPVALEYLQLSAVYILSV